MSFFSVNNIHNLLSIVTFSVLMKPWEADFTLYFESCFVYIHYFTLSGQCCVTWLWPPPVAQWNGVDPLAGRHTVSLECTCVCMSVRTKQNRGPLIKTLLSNVVKNSTGCLKARQMASNFTSKHFSFFLPQYRFVYSCSRNTDKCFFKCFCGPTRLPGPKWDVVFTVLWMTLAHK